MSSAQCVNYIYLLKNHQFSAEGFQVYNISIWEVVTKRSGVQQKVILSQVSWFEDSLGYTRHSRKQNINKRETLVWIEPSGL